MLNNLFISVNSVRFVNYDNYHRRSLAPVRQAAYSQNMNKTINSYLLSLVIAFCFPAIIIYGGLNHHLNSLYYSGHGGLGLFSGYLCFPWIIFIFTKHAIRKKGKERTNRFIFAMISIVSYSLLTIPFSSRVAENLNIIWGLPDDWKIFWSIINFPLSLLVSLFH